jgi:hypothetical protein
VKKIRAKTQAKSAPVIKAVEAMKQEPTAKVNELEPAKEAVDKLKSVLGGFGF